MNRPWIWASCVVLGVVCVVLLLLIVRPSTDDLALAPTLEDYAGVWRSEDGTLVLEIERTGRARVEAQGSDYRAEGSAAREGDGARLCLRGIEGDDCALRVRPGVRENTLILDGKGDTFVLERIAD